MFSHGFKCSDFHKIEKLIISSINVFELCFSQDQNVWRHKLTPTEIGKNDSDRVGDFLIFKNLFVLFKKLHIFLGKHNCKFECGRCLSSYTSQNVINNEAQATMSSTGNNEY